MGMTKLSKSKSSSLVKKQNNKRIKIPKWDSFKKKDFISNIDLEQVSYVSDKLNCLLSSNAVTSENINEIVNHINNNFKTAAMEARVPENNNYKYGYSKINHRKGIARPWFNDACEEMCKTFSNTKICLK